MAKTVVWHLADHEATHRAGIALGRHLAPGMLVTLSGELGAGKTTLCRGIAAGMGVGDLSQVTSPTYALMHEYVSGRCSVVHIDAYRLSDATHATELGLEEAWLREDALVLIEWPERLGDMLPAADVAAELRVVNNAGKDARSLRIRAELALDEHFAP